jgi:hypothetical protein
MDYLPAAAALAVMLITAGFILRTTPGSTTAEPITRSPIPPVPAFEDGSDRDPWVVEREPLVLEELPAPVAGQPAPVLAYVEQPRRSPHAERLIQTEVLEESGSVAHAWRAIRLLVSLLALGALLGFGAVAFVRAVVWLLT